MLTREACYDWVQTKALTASSRRITIPFSDLICDLSLVKMALTDHLVS